MTAMGLYIGCLETREYKVGLNIFCDVFCYDKELHNKNLFVEKIILDSVYIS